MFAIWATFQIFSCFFMTGLIWVIQLIHYPAFKFGDHAQFPSLHKFHVEKIGLIVAPVMGLELISSAILFWMMRDLVTAGNCISVALLWVITACQLAPLHKKLSPEFDLELIRQLVRKNWIRTFVWSCRSLFLSLKLYQLIV